MQSLTFYGFAAAAVFLYAIQPILAKKAQGSIPPFAFIAITMAVLALLALGASMLFERQFDVRQMQMSSIRLVLLFGFVNFLSFSLFLKAISGIPAAHYQIIGGVLAPILSAAFAYIFLGETVATGFFVAVPLAFLTLYLALHK